MLDNVHHAGIRLSIVAYRTSPVTNLCGDDAEPLLYIHRMSCAELLFQCFIFSFHPTHN